LTPTVALGTECEVVGRRAHELAQLLARRGEQLGQAVEDEPHRLALELALPGLVPLEHGPWAGPERAVVQVGDVWIEKEELPHEGAEVTTGSGRRPRE
jgi:hypothetical protein